MINKRHGRSLKESQPIIRSADAASRSTTCQPLVTTVCQNWSSCVKYTPSANSFLDWRLSSPPRPLKKEPPSFKSPTSIPGRAMPPIFPDAQCRQYQIPCFASACQPQGAVDLRLTTRREEHACSPPVSSRIHP